MDILVTGASGFIGQDIVRQLVNGNTIYALSRHFSNKINDVNYVENDLLDEIKIPCSNIDVVIHAAGQAHIVQNDETKPLFYRNNVQATDNILNTALKLNAKRFIYLSTVAVTNNDENDYYASSKKEAENHIVRFCSQHNIPYTIIRPVVVYGENDIKGNFYKMISQMRKGFFPLVNNGKTKKDILYVRNLSFIISEIIKFQQFNNQILIAKDNKSLNFKDICLLIKRDIQDCKLIPIPLLFINSIASIISLCNSIGLKSPNANSIKKLCVDSNFSINSNNQRLLDKNPFSSALGIANTINWVINK